jgi:hypothetical protein
MIAGPKTCSGFGWKAAETAPLYEPDGAAEAAPCPPLSRRLGPGIHVGCRMAADTHALYERFGAGESQPVYCPSRRGL